MQEIHVVDSHTGGEPTRLVVDGGPQLKKATVAKQLEELRSSHDWLRRSVILEPRGSDVLVGALLVEPSDPSCEFGVIFFDNVKYLGMCGHGTIGVAASLAHLGKLNRGQHRFETPTGIVTAELHSDGSVSITNVPSYRSRSDVAIITKSYGTLIGDIAWGGNWFLIVKNYPLEIRLPHVEALTDVAWDLRQSVNAQGYPDVDHIVLLGPSSHRDANAVNFVLCPGKAYDRSPCGTGTSAILACLAAENRLEPGVSWIQESIIGSRFVGTYTWDPTDHARIVPTIRGHAYVTSRATLMLDPKDPYCYGISQ